MSVAGLVGSGPLLLAIPVAAAAGAVTFLSPCCLPLVPGYLSFITGMTGADAAKAADASQAEPAEVIPGETAASQLVTTVGGSRGEASASERSFERSGEPRRAPALSGGPPGEPDSTDGGCTDGGPGGLVYTPQKSRALAGTMLFILGFSAVFATYGTLFGGLGQLLRGHGQQTLTQVLGGLTILLGLLFAGAFERFSFAGRIIRPSVAPRAGLAGAPLLGVLFGVGWSPCIGPTLSAVMGLSAVSGTAARGAFLAFVYGLGLGIPFLLVSVAFQRMMRMLSFFRRNARLVTRIGGAMLVIVGVLEVTGAWTAALSWLQVHWISESELPL
jgi:cytochrome c-type biogenesis protein